MIYVTIVRGRCYGTLVGPFETDAEARLWVDPAREAAIKIDPFAHFDGFGTAMLRGMSSPGKLNGRVGYVPKVSA